MAPLQPSPKEGARQAEPSAAAAAQAAGDQKTDLQVNRSGRQRCECSSWWPAAGAAAACSSRLATCR